MTKENSLKDFIGKVKALLRGERAPRVVPPPHPMACVMCGDPGLHPAVRLMANGKGRTEWYCERDFPPFLRRDRPVPSVAPARFAGDPCG
jgi:hypothetical protein